MNPTEPRDVFQRSSTGFYCTGEFPKTLVSVTLTHLRNARSLSSTCTPTLPTQHPKCSQITRTASAGRQAFLQEHRQASPGRCCPASFLPKRLPSRAEGPTCCISSAASSSPLPTPGFFRTTPGPALGVAVVLCVAMGLCGAERGAELFLRGETSRQKIPPDKRRL